MILPKLKTSGRAREYRLRSYSEIAKIVEIWLFHSDIGHREMDRDVLGLDPSMSRGYQSMGVLHFLGLKKEFKGIFHEIERDEAISHLESDEQNFDFIIELLRSLEPDSENKIIESLYDSAISGDSKFVEHYHQRLQELASTDSHVGYSLARKEQGILRSMLLRGHSEGQCALCHRNLPADLIVAAHIKPRNKCSLSERKDPNIVMAACKLGCDELFEKGYIIVDGVGRIILNDKVRYSLDLTEYVDSFKGNTCTAFNENTERFFAYKRESLS